MTEFVRMRIVRATAVPVLALSMLGATGCGPLQTLLQALAGTGANTGLTTNPSTLSPQLAQNPAAPANGTNPPSLLNGGQQNPSSPAAVLPAPAESAQAIQQLTQKYGIQVAGSCAKGTDLQTLDQALGLLADKSRIQGLTYNIPCETQDGGGGTAGEWLGEETNGPYRIDFKGPPFAPLGRGLYLHETGHHLHLAHTNTTLRQTLESTVQTTPEWYPSAYSKPGFDGRPGPETITKQDGSTAVIDLDKGEQIAELIAYCKELANGGVQDPQPDDTPNWQCPATMTTVVQSI